MIRINETAWGDMHMLKLVKLKREDMSKLLDMMDEWTASHTRGTGLILDDLSLL